MENLRRQLIVAFGVMLLVVAAGTIGYYAMGAGRWTLFDCFYMTIITLTTVGYAEVLERFEQVPYARAFTVGLLVFGMGTVVYFASAVTALLIEGDLRRAFRRTRMRKQIQKLRDHVVVCGAGSTGRHAIEELMELEIPTVAIDTDRARLEELAERFPRHFHFIVGDATDDDVLVRSSVATARGLVVALHGDKDNLFVVVSVRQMNEHARIVARGSDLQILEKLKKAGADTVVSPNYIGGMRMVSELVRPHVVRFLDEMRRDTARVRIEEVGIPDRSALAGEPIATARIGEPGTELVLLAVNVPDEEGYRYNVAPDLVLAPGMTLVLLGPLADIEALRRRTAPTVTDGAAPGPARS